MFLMFLSRLLPDLYFSLLPLSRELPESGGVYTIFIDSHIWSLLSSPLTKVGVNTVPSITQAGFGCYTTSRTEYNYFTF